MYLNLKLSLYDIETLGTGTKYKIMLGKSESKTPLGRTKNRCEDNIKICVKRNANDVANVGN